MIKSFGLIPLIFLSMSLAACVTINIYFPAAAAEKVADRIIEEVWDIDESVDAEGQADESKPR
jgi:uncharacterized OsmC-like protein